MDGTYITATRTAAGAALATRLLAREDARVLAILGAGVQARTHAAALRRVREFDEIRVASRDRTRAEAVARDIGATAAPSFEEAVRGADVVAVEYRESTLAPPPAGAPEFRDGAPSEVVELGELVAGTKPGRTSPEQISLYKSVGVAVQDAAAAALVLAAARERSVGREIELEESG